MFVLRVYSASWHDEPNQTWKAFEFLWNDILQPQKILGMALFKLVSLIYLKPLCFHFSSSLLVAFVACSPPIATCRPSANSQILQIVWAWSPSFYPNKMWMVDIPRQGCCRCWEPSDCSRKLMPKALPIWQSQCLLCHDCEQQPPALV